MASAPLATPAAMLAASCWVSIGARLVLQRTPLIVGTVLRFAAAQTEIGHAASAHDLTLSSSDTGPRGEVTRERRAHPVAEWPSAG